MNKHLITFLLFLLALVLYIVGMALTATLFMLMGAVAELVFWLRILGIRRSRSD